MTTNQPPRKRTMLEVITDVENGELTAEQAVAELEAEDSTEENAGS